MADFIEIGFYDIKIDDVVRVCFLVSTGGNRYFTEFIGKVRDIDPDVVRISLGSDIKSELPSDKLSCFIDVARANDVYMGSGDIMCVWKQVVHDGV